jgi:MFS family permease
VVLILVVQVMFGFGWSLYLLMPKFLTTALHVGPDTIGAISAVGGLAGLLTVPFAGIGLDRFGRKPFFRLGAALVIALSLGYLQVREMGPLVYVLQGCVSAAFVLAFNASAALLADFAPPERLGQAIGWLGGANVLMNAVATMIAEPLAMEHGWHVVFWIGVAAGSAALLGSFALRDAPARPLALDGSQLQAAVPRTSPGATMVPVLFATVLVGGVFAAMFSFVQPYAISLGAREVRNFFLGFTASAVAGRVLLGGLGDRLGRRRVSGVVVLGYGLSALLTMRLDPDRLLATGLIFGAAHGLLYPTMNALVLEIMPSVRRGLGMVLYNGAFNTGSMLGSLGLGVLAKERGYPTLYAVASGAALLAACVLTYTPRTRR